MTTTDETTTEQMAAPISGLSHVQLMVSDVRASARWYTDVLGLAPFVQNLDIGYVALRHRAAKLVIVLSQRADPVGPAADHLVDHIAFAVPDGETLRSWAEHLTEVGIAHPGVVLENGNPSLQLRDPDGMAIELVAPRA